MSPPKTSSAAATILAAFGLCGGLAMTACRANPPVREDVKPKGVAVVELFTSEGCSSCPSAEAALAELVEKSRGRPVYALAFHVDYFDGLGWADRFAMKAFTERQVRYAESLKTDQVYTPQVVVNGTADVLGSDRAKLNATVAEAVNDPVVATLAGIATLVDGGGLRVAITSAGLPAGAIVNVALVENDVVSDVRRGENGGRRLVHERVVRSLRSVEADGRGAAAVELGVPADARPDHASLVLFAQGPRDLRVLGATEVSLPK